VFKSCVGKTRSPEPLENCSIQAPYKQTQQIAFKQEVGAYILIRSQDGAKRKKRLLSECAPAKAERRWMKWKTY